MALAAPLMAAPAMVLAHAHESSHPPCGAGAGGLQDPAETKRCLAERFKPSEPKPAKAPAPTPPAAPDSQSTN